MKFSFIIIVLAFGICSCLNDNISLKPSNNKIDTLALLVGKWKIEKDSFFIGSLGVNKMKTDSDYYDFQQDGRLLIKEGTQHDTAIFSLKAKSNIYISFKGKATIYSLNEINVPVGGEVIVDRISGNYLINNFSDSLISLSIASFLRPPEIVEGVSDKLSSKITLKK